MNSLELTPDGKQAKETGKIILRPKGEGLLKVKLHKDKTYKKLHLRIIRESRSNSDKIIDPLWVFGSPRTYCQLYCKFKINFLFQKIREKRNTFRAAQLINVSQNYLPTYIERVEALEIFLMQKRIMQIEGYNIAVNMKSM